MTSRAPNVPPIQPDLERRRDSLFRGLRRQVPDGPVLEAMRRVRRDLMVPDEYRSQAYDDMSLPIDGGKTISQPRIVAEMTSALRLAPGDLVLDVGTGSGYQAAVASLLAGRVVSVEVVPEIAGVAARRLRWLGYRNVTVHLAGATLGREEESPYDAIVVAAGAPSIPESLLAQLRVGGRMVIPVGGREFQVLTCLTRTAAGVTIDELGPCQFVPLVGREAWPQ